jgi:hypothetical protein
MGGELARIGLLPLTIGPRRTSSLGALARVHMLHETWKAGKNWLFAQNPAPPPLDPSLANMILIPSYSWTWLAFLGTMASCFAR